MNDTDNEAEARRRKSRARARLHALGIDLETMDHEQIHQAWEDAHAAYLQTAQAGRHYARLHLEDDQLPGACAHARHGMLADAIEDLYGAHPDGWSSPRPEWPSPSSSCGTPS
jgi:hypothetical protein